jgi:hypothetical protein
MRQREDKGCGCRDFDSAERQFREEAGCEETLGDRACAFCIPEAQLWLLLLMCSQSADHLRYLMAPLAPSCVVRIGLLARAVR